MPAVLGIGETCTAGSYEPARAAAPATFTGIFLGARHFFRFTES